MFEIDSLGRVARISFARPEARNAVPVARWQDFRDAVARIAATDARVLVLRSAVPGIFSAGADIGDFRGLETDVAGRVRFRTEMGGAVEALAALPIATIAAVDGGCFGAAVALALACDIRIAGSGARFGTTPAKMGIAYPIADVVRLKALVGPGQAARMLFSAMTIDAAEAARIGLVDEAADDAETAAMALATTIAANSPSSVRTLKRIIGGDPASDALFDDSFGGADFLEGTAAFHARRKAEFGG